MSSRMGVGFCRVPEMRKTGGLAYQVGLLAEGNSPTIGTLRQRICLQKPAVQLQKLDPRSRVRTTGVLSRAGLHLMFFTRLSFSFNAREPDLFLSARDATYA